MQHDTVERLEQIYRASPYRQIRAIRCQLDDEVLTLHGAVESYFLKQQAQVIAQSLDATIEVNNQIDVTEEGR